MLIVRLLPVGFYQKRFYQFHHAENVSCLATFSASRFVGSFAHIVEAFTVWESKGPSRLTKEPGLAIC